MTDLPLRIPLATWRRISNPFRSRMLTMKLSPRESSLDHGSPAAIDQGFVSIDTETDSLDAMQANIVGVSLALAPGKACYIPLAHTGQGAGLFGGGKIEGQIARDVALAKLKPLFEAPSCSEDRAEPQI